MTISTYQLKSRFQSLLRPLAVWLYQHHVTANQVTIAACFISVVLGVLAAIFPERNYLFY